MGSGCGTVGSLIVLSPEKTKINEKEAGNCPLKKC